MFTIVHANTDFKVLDTDGTVYTTLTLPAGVTVDNTVRAQFHMLANKLIITRAPSVNLWVNPRDFTVRPLAVLPPSAPPTVASGAATGLTGSYYAAYSYVVQIDGLVVQESPLSPISTQLVLADAKVNWSNLIPSSEAHVTGYRLYRTVADGDPTTMFLAQEIGNQTDTSYTGDAVADAALDLLPSPLTGNAPGGTTPGTRLQVCTEWGNRLWGVPDDDSLRHRVYYTEVENPFAWRATNFLNMPVAGEDEFGVIGFLRRRDELVCGKRRRICKIVGGSALDFEVIILAEGPGFIAPDSCVVIDDIGYALGEEGVWSVGPEGVTSVSEDKVATWFQTDQQFNPESRARAVAGYNPATQTYDIHQSTANDLAVSNTVDAWASFGKATQEWTGAHATSAFTPLSRGTRYNDDGELVPVMGGSDGYVYDMNQAAAYDLAGGSATVIGIYIDWRTKSYVGGDPDIFCFFGRPTIHQRAQGDASGFAEIMAFCGDYDERDQSVANNAIPKVWTESMPLSVARYVLPRIGAGQAAHLWIRHNFGANSFSGAIETTGVLPQDVEIWGIELPFTPIGRR